MQRICTPCAELLPSNEVKKSHYRPSGFQEAEAPRFQDIRHMKVVRLSALRTGTGTHFCKSLSQPQGHSAAGRIISKKNSNDTMGNRTRDFPICSAVPTAPSRAHLAVIKRTFKVRAGRISLCLGKSESTYFFYRKSQRRVTEPKYHSLYSD